VSASGTPSGSPASAVGGAATRPVLAALWMMGSVASFTSMAIAGRQVSFELDTFEIMTYRSLIGIIVVALVISLRRQWTEVSASHLPLHAARNVAHFTGQNLWFYAITTIPLAQVFSLEFTSPLWVLVLSPLILGERLTRARALAALMGFAGILLVARPGAAPVTPGLLAAAACALGFAFTYILTKKLTGLADNATILWWMVVMQAVFGLVCGLADGAMALPSAASWPWLALIGCAGLFAHFCIASALRLAPAIFVMPFDFLRLPVIALVGWALYAEPIGPFVVAGAALILTGNVMNLRAQARERAGAGGATVRR